jgi:two-component system cell cycle response regulator DivK
MTRNLAARPTVLVVDDIDDTRFVLRRMLEMRECRVLEAADGVGAVEAARRECPDLILMDLNLPGLDGLEATRLIRGSGEACAGVRVVAVTAHNALEMAAAARESGCDDYIVKPIDFDVLRRVLRRHLPGW